MRVGPAENATRSRQPLLATVEQLGHVTSPMTDGVEDPNDPSSSRQRINGHPDLALVELEHLGARLREGMAQGGQRDVTDTGHFRKLEANEVRELSCGERHVPQYRRLARAAGACAARRPV